MDAFDVLGVAANSDKDTCKQAYRKLAMQHHPDKGGDTVKFQAIQKAWEQIEGGYRRFIRRGPEVPNPGVNRPSSFFFKQDTGATKSSRASSFADVFENFQNVHSTWGNNGQTIVRAAAAKGAQEFNYKGHTFTIPHGVPDGWSRTLSSQHEMIGGSKGMSRDFKIKVTVPHDESMQIQGIDMSMGRVPFANQIGDCVCAINTSAINLVLGAWVQVKDVFGDLHTVRIPEGFNPDNRLRVAGAGYYHWDAARREPITTSRGDLFIRVVPQFTSWNDMPEADKAMAKEKLETILA